MSAASRVGSINVVLQTTFGPAVTGLNTFAGAVEKTGRRTQTAVGGIDRSIIGMNRTMGGIGANSSGFRGLAISALRTRDSIGQMNSMLLATSALVGGLAPTLSGAYLLKMSDRAQLVSNNLRTVTEDTTDLKNIQEELFQVAQRTRSSYESTATIYARTARATEAFGYSQEKLLRITETVNKAFAAGGANPAEAKGAAIQLTQGIASDRFSGDEFRSVAENAPVLLKGMADALNVNIGKLREMAHAGELTARTVTEAILQASASIDEDFGKTISTIGQAMTKLDNAILKFVSDSENMSVASQGVVTIINAISSNIDTTVDSVLLLAGALTATFAGRRLADLYAYTAGLNKNLTAQVANTAAALNAAKAEAAAASMRAKAAAAQYTSLRQGVVSASTMNKAQKELSSSVAAHVSSQASLKSAIELNSKAMQSASLAGKALAVTGRLVQGAWAFVGGPFGAALLAAGAAMYYVQKQSQDAADRSARYADAIQDAGDKSKMSANGIREAGMALAELGKFATRADLQTTLTKTKNDLAEFNEKLTEFSFLDAFSSTPAAIGSLKNLGLQLVDNKISLEDYIAATDRLARSNPNLSETIADFQKTAREAEAAEGKTQGLIDRMDALDGKKAEATIVLRTITEGGKEDLQKKLIEQQEGILKDRVKENKSITALQARMFSDILDGIEPKKTKKARKSDAEKQIERLDKALDKLDYTIESSKLTELDKKTIEAANSAGVAESKIRQFIEAVQGNGEVPAELESIRSRLQMIADIEFKKSLAGLSESNVVAFLSELDREVVSTARSFGVAEEKVKAFISAAASGATSGFPEEITAIRTELEKGIANQTIIDGMDGVADLVGQLASDLFDNPRDGANLFEGALDSLKKLFFQLLIVEPLVRSIRSALGGSNFFSALLGGGGGGPTNIIPGGVPLNHTGGDAGVSNVTRAVSMSDLAGAQKFHTGKSGVKHGEVMALLEESESVYTANQNGRIADALGAAAMGGQANTGGGTVVNIHNGSGEKVTQKSSNSGGVDIVDVFIGKVEKAIGSGKMDSAMAGRYNNKPAVRNIG